jgi:transposase-like protein
VARALLSNLVARGLDASRPMVFAIDGSPALRKAIREVWGTGGVVQRCQIHYADERIMPSSTSVAA